MLLRGLLLLFLLETIFSCGCASKNSVHNSLLPPQPFHPHNIYRAQNLPQDCCRIAILPVHFNDPAAPFLQTLDQVFFSEVSKQGRFEVIAIDRAFMLEAIGRPTLASTDPIPTDFVEEVKKKYHVDGLLLTDITTYRAYKPQLLGVRSKLIQLPGYIYWACDTVFDAGNESVAYGACQYQKYAGKNAFPIDTSEVILQSPSCFAQYVAFEVFQSLPSRKNG